MLVKYATEDHIRAALDHIQEKYDHNLEFREGTPDPQGGKGFRVRLGVKDNHAKGASVKQRYSFDGFEGERHLRAACWHVHGDFFDELFSCCPYAVIVAQNKVIRKDEGNWQDYNVGSQMYPVYASESCDCDGAL